jgi:hypothetical protein
MVDGQLVEGVLVEEWSVSAPKQVVSLVQVKGRSGRLDLSTVDTGGMPTFDDRVLKVACRGWDDDAEGRLAGLRGLWHGRMIEVGVGGGPWVWRGRGNVSATRWSGRMFGFNLSNTVEPYRLAAAVTRVSAVASVSGVQVTLPAAGVAGMPVAPTVKTTGACVLVVGGKQISLPAGVWPGLTDFWLGPDEDVVVVVKGQPSVTVAFEWRAGRL